MEITIIILILISVILFYFRERSRKEYNNLSESYYVRGQQLDFLEEDIRILVEGDIAEKLPVEMKYKMQYNIEKQIWIGRN